MNAEQPKIVMRGLTKTFETKGEPLLVLDDIDLTVDRVDEAHRVLGDEFVSYRLGQNLVEGLNSRPGCLWRCGLAVEAKFETGHRRFGALLVHPTNGWASFGEPLGEG